ncbi:MAG TPA: TonB-dependent receptor [Bacteroidales bacterium]|nr:TonB-dependent receptor [Bacteroidales bacterium]HPS17785.1 TonB-dependent receptor [Bacteroidales bacterium]
MKKIIFICVLVLSFQFTFSQNSIKGKIIDTDNKPLTGATIFLTELNKSTISNQNGEFFLNNLPNGKIKIQVSFIGYANAIETIFLNNKNVELNITMKETAIETEEIVVSGGYSSTQHDNAVKIDVLKLNERINTVSPNFTEILTKVPGVDMISKGNGVSKPVIRGLGMDNVVILNNGVRFENYQYSDHHPLGIDEFGIEDVEIIKGPASLLYGSDAIGGVINFIKEKPAAIGKIQGDYNLQLFSNSLGAENNLGIKGASKKLFGGIRFGNKTNADYLQGGGNFVPNTRFNEISLKANGGYSSKIGIFKMFYDYNQQKLGLAEDEPIEEITSRGRKNEIWYEQMNNHLLSSQNRIFLNKYKLEINAALQSADLIHYADIDITEISMNLKTLTYETKLYLPSNEKSEYIIGIQGLNQVNKNFNHAEVILLPDAHTDNYSAFTLLQYTVFKKLKLQTGIRYDYKLISTEAVGQTSDYNYREALNINYNSFSGSIGTTYNLSEKILFRTNFATAYRTPNLAELTSNGIHEIRYELGNSSLSPQNAYETDMSMHYHVNDFTLDIAGFYNIINKYIYISPTNDTIASGETIYKYMQSDAVLYGGETGIHFHPKKIKWLHLESKFSTVTGKQINGNHLPYIPAKKLSFEIMAEKEKISFLHDVFIKIISSTAFEQNDPSPEEEEAPGYSLFNLGTGASIKSGKQMISLAFGVNNIFDKKYIDHLSTLKEVGFYNPGRNFTLSVKIPFEF